MKNLFKKIGALLVAAVMVLSMCTAAFAADGKIVITVNDENGNLLSEEATLKYLQVLHRIKQLKQDGNLLMVLKPHIKQLLMFPMIS